MILWFYKLVEFIWFILVDGRIHFRSWGTVRCTLSAMPLHMCISGKPGWWQPPSYGVLKLLRCLVVCPEWAELHGTCSSFWDQRRGRVRRHSLVGCTTWMKLRWRKIRRLSRLKNQVQTQLLVLLYLTPKSCFLFERFQSDISALLEHGKSEAERSTPRKLKRVIWITQVGDVLFNNYCGYYKNLNKSNSST